MLLNCMVLRMIDIRTDKNLSPDEIEYLLEAAFFALSRPMRVNEIAGILDQEERVVRSIVKKIRAKYKKNGFAFRLDEIATDVFMIRINEDLEDILKDILEGEDLFKFNQIEIDVLTHLVYQQPIRQNDLLKMIEKHKKKDITKAVDILKVEDYIFESKEKNAIILRTTNKFALEFGFSTEMKHLKQQLYWRLKRNA